MPSTASVDGRDVSAPKIDENKVAAALARVFEPSDDSTEEDEEGFKKPKTRKKQKKRREARGILWRF